jgi:hypothetical protein
MLICCGFGIQILDKNDISSLNVLIDPVTVLEHQFLDLNTVGMLNFYGNNPEKRPKVYQ